MKQAEIECGDLTALKMPEAIFVQGIRGFLESNEAPEWGLSAFPNNNLRRMLDVFHIAPNVTWTVENITAYWYRAAPSQERQAIQFLRKLASRTIQGRKKLLGENPCL
ncbi:hypothetical protein [Cochlodiniinecator piscidefendens]|uniref:hypothetical protein n=1 Tax=Cochlodiniinecator piscidefendens TaxID=2715756 RepID=UPI00140839E4|nr:hypothetical protein [Cochlodiniinecator piscidefendens]